MVNYVRKLNEIMKTNKENKRKPRFEKPVLKKAHQ